jgi:hypothetical protein
MRGDTHVRFGGAGTGNGPGNPGTAPVPDPNRPDRPPCDAPTWTPLATGGVVQDPPSVPRRKFV